MILISPSALYYLWIIFIGSRASENDAPPSEPKYDIVRNTERNFVEPRYDSNGNKLSPEQISEYRILMEHQNNNLHPEDNALYCGVGSYSYDNGATGTGGTCVRPVIRLQLIACPRRLGTAVPEVRNLLSEEELAELELLPDSVSVPPVVVTERYTRTIGTLTLVCASCPPCYFCSDGYNYYICPAGSYCPNSGMSNPYTCGAGTYSGSGTTSCTTVSAGYYAGSGSSVQTACPAGTYSSAGASSCTSVAAGYYANAVIAATGQTACAAGTYAPNSGSTACLSCAPRTSLPGATTCMDWPSSQPSRHPSSQPTRQPSRQPTSQPSSHPSRPTGQPTGQPSRQPTTQPWSRPSSQPTRHPSTQPSLQPTCKPSTQPTLQPTRQPSGQPTGRPSRQPTSQPSEQPSGQPSAQPTGQPSVQPSLQPTGQPSIQPSTRPSGHPTVRPTRQPSVQPTSQPTEQPTSQPSGQPFARPSAHPSTRPASRPSTQPTSIPSSQPSAPSSRPTRQPTMQPSHIPSSVPSSQPVGSPSAHPSRQPSSQPSQQPSTKPSIQPVSSPSSEPSSYPSGQPTRRPSGQPSAQPSRQPSSVPTMQPSVQPTTQPSGRPSAQPSVHPSTQPMAMPSAQPTSKPTIEPSSQPTSQPSFQPSVQPSEQPTCHPSTQPTLQPSVEPSSVPTCQPTDQPSMQPLNTPTLSPSEQPTGKPTSQPTQYPTTKPSSTPSAQPSLQPSIQPSRNPSSNPSAQPSAFPTVKPIGVPTNQPSATPSAEPSAQPSRQPMSEPSSLPSSTPSEQPSAQPSSQPSIPTGLPTSRPSLYPTVQPSNPSGQPTVQPSELPSGRPTCQPSAPPSDLPSARPSEQPSSQPTTQPSARPSSQPSVQPSSQPSVHPNAKPSSQPSSQPTSRPSSILIGTAPQPSLILLPEDISSFKIILPFMQVDRVMNEALSRIKVPNGSFGVNYVVSGINCTSNMFIPADGVVPYSSAVASDFNGRSVSFLRDYNADGMVDLIVGDPFVSKSYIIFGSVDGFNTGNMITIVGETEYDLLGWSVSDAGDFNKDGYNDVVIGAPNAFGIGAVYILYGGRSTTQDLWLSSLSPDVGFMIVGEGKGHCLGLSVSSAGDFNKDTYADVVIGAAVIANYYSGTAYVVYGSPMPFNVDNIAQLVPLSAFKLSGVAYSMLGNTVCSAGDINGDGFDDVLIGTNPQVSRLSSVVYLIFGTVSLSSLVVTNLELKQGLSVTGANIAIGYVGDVNQDGFNDFMLGSNYDYSKMGGFFIKLNRSEQSLSPTAGPTVISFPPSVKPSKSISRRPNVIPTLTPTEFMHPIEPTISGLPTVVRSPTFLWSTHPTESTYPTDLSLFTSEPSEQPTELPSMQPSESPSTKTSIAPFSTRSPITYPTCGPSTLMPTQITETYIVQGGTYSRPDGSMIYHVNSTCTITGALGSCKFIVYPSQGTSLTIEIFNVSRDVIDLTHWSDYQSYTDLPVVAGSLIIVLKNSQKIRLENLTPEDMPKLMIEFQSQESQTHSTGPSDDLTTLSSVCAFIVIIGLLRGYLWFRKKTADEHDLEHFRRITEVTFIELKSVVDDEGFSLESFSADDYSDYSAEISANLFTISSEEKEDRISNCSPPLSEYTIDTNDSFVKFEVLPSCSED